jgi:hypothetical protein
MASRPHGGNHTIIVPEIVELAAVAAVVGR